MLELFEQIESSRKWIQERWPHSAKAGLILGTGLGDLARKIEVEATLPYEDIPHFPKSTAPKYSALA